MIVTIHQPDFCPWLGFFDRLRASDLYVVLDDAQFIRRGWHHRDKIKTPHGVKWLTVPVKKKGRFAQTIRETEIDETSDWRSKHLGALKAAYAKAPAFADIYPRIREVYDRGHRLLMDLNLDLLRLFAALLEIDTPWAMASDTPSSATSSERLAELCALHGADTYMTGTGSRDYLQEEPFASRGVAVSWQRFDHPVYPQLHGPFEPGMSVVDYCMHIPPAERGNHADA